MPSIRLRLQQAALELFGEQGYERTTATEIAKRVGVTERTFFRHFADKREVLFDGEAVLREALTSAIAAMPSDTEPMAVLFEAFRSVVPILEGNRPFAEPRQRVIAATPPLREREIAKHADLANVLANCLMARGISSLRAALAAGTAMGAFVHATLSWLDDPSGGLEERLNHAERELAALFAPGRKSKLVVRSRG